MTADQLIQYLSWLVYMAIFVVTAGRAVRRPSRANVDIALFFTASAAVIAVSVAQRLDIVPQDTFINDLTGSLIFVFVYLLLRLTYDFTDFPAWLMRTYEVALPLLIVANVITAPKPPGWQVLLELAYLITALACAMVAFERASRKTRGVTRRRMRAVSIGSFFLVAGFGLIAVGVLFPSAAGLFSSLYDITGLFSAVSYYFGFATPSLLRRAWQEPELRSFLGQAAGLPRIPDTASIVRMLETGAAGAVGAPSANIGLWDEHDKVLRYKLLDGEELVYPATSEMLTGRVFIEQRPIFSVDLDRDSPNYATDHKRHGAVSMLAAPITAADKRLGVLAVYAPSAPIFAEDDLALVKLLADQAAVILESRALLDEAGQVRAREEVARLKEDFLSAAAHDLKTPLTTLVAQTQLLERRARKTPDAPADLAGIQRVEREAQRLRTLVLELLDAARAEQGKLVGERERLDLNTLADEVCRRHANERHACVVQTSGSVSGMYDRIRMQQLLENLVENAIKYSPNGGPVHMQLWQDGDWNHITVADQGIGIPADDLPRIFDRFHRGKNVDDRRFAGMGLGLFICKSIVEQHGGQINVTSGPKGTTFHVDIPVSGEPGDAHSSAGLTAVGANGLQAVPAPAFSQIRAGASNSAVGASISSTSSSTARDGLPVMREQS